MLNAATFSWLPKDAINLHCQQIASYSNPCACLTLALNRSDCLTTKQVVVRSNDCRPSSNNLIVNRKLIANANQCQQAANLMTKLLVLNHIRIANQAPATETPQHSNNLSYVQQLQMAKDFPISSHSSAVLNRPTFYRLTIAIS